MINDGTQWAGKKWYCYGTSMTDNSGDPTSTTGRMEGTTSYGGICSACRIDLRSGKVMAMWSALHLSGVGQMQTSGPPPFCVFLPLQQ